MSDISIRVEGLGKMYHIGGELRRHAPCATRSSSRLSGLSSASAIRALWPPSEELWALRDVSLRGPRGRGRSASSAATAPARARCSSSCRASPSRPTGQVDTPRARRLLLEVGTGFHPELTGRENIFLNGAILGMTRAEIRRKFDEIVEFAEVERFLDTPVKRYSSGMYVRLAFAVAAHLEPEILLVDEVLAVGDAAFQRKCLGKMERGGGRRAAPCCSSATTCRPSAPVHACHRAQGRQHRELGRAVRPSSTPT